MAKKLRTPEVPEVEQPETLPEKRERLELFIGVNFTALGETEETRIEPGLIDLGVLPSAFENLLIERKQARVRLV